MQYLACENSFKRDSISVWCDSKWKNDEFLKRAKKTEVFLSLDRYSITWQSRSFKCLHSKCSDFKKQFISEIKLHVELNSVCFACLNFWHIEINSFVIDPSSKLIRLCSFQSMCLRLLFIEIRSEWTPKSIFPLQNERKNNNHTEFLFRLLKH